MGRLVLLLLLLLVTACPAARDPVGAGPIVAGPVDAGPPAAAATDAGPAPAALPPEPAGLAPAREWRSYGDALARAGRREEAVGAYARCSLAAGEDFEMSLYCQAAAAVAKKVRAAPK